MNLRSVFTVEQQRILERYYENGMTNQSKTCFQLILQCAQEAKLDFSVVRTWVGNKRRKMTAKIQADGGPLPSQATPSSVAAEVPARNVPTTPRTPGQQSPRTSPSNDVFVTGVYTAAQSSASRQGATPQTANPALEVPKATSQRPPAWIETELQQHLSLPRQAPFSKNTIMPFSEKNAALLRHPSVASSAGSMYSHAKKSYNVSSVETAEGTPSQKTGWTKQYAAEPAGAQRSLKTKPSNASPLSLVPCGPRASYRDPVRSSQNLEICEVFSLANEQPQRILGGLPPAKPPRQSDSGCFSIAMETGDVDDEYAREEELASMGAELQSYARVSERVAAPPMEVQRTASPLSARNLNRDLPENPLYHNRDYPAQTSTSLQISASALFTSAISSRNNFWPQFTTLNQQNHQRQPQNQNNYQISGNLTVPWITGCSRKRTLQDRTQFSDQDLATLKKYWDNGMTSLGSVCREKIEVVASELSVDCEIVRTWIGNRRRKYRLMGIEVPPPRGGPADFSDQPVSGTPSLATPDEEAATEGDEDNDRNDEVSIYLSEEEPSEAGQQEEVQEKEDDQNATSTDNVKIEVIDDEEDLLSNSDVEQMRALLEYKNEEVRYLENELENHKNQYFNLQTFTRNLVLAIKSNNTEQQQVLLSNLPPEVEELDFSNVVSESDDTSQN
ncbi:highly divergent homeobox [Latimeria chalumnae]|uniref:highly divergent homeobox n=1 Tax=Latimeria chalumnae TaxID=7897 RepID=UPI0006D92CF2|nr:PREDICTED: highly divergent homeobox [Latimeria chalumnae]|eukprot:XP_014346753.1 PREDICTED: highly divergent homeobox [Latimeria chalumnae]